MTLSELIGQDIPLVKSGSSDRYWRGKEHDSLVIDNQRGKWNWFSKSLWGDARDWIVYWRRLPGTGVTSLVTQVDGYEASKLPPQLNADTYRLQVALLNNRAARTYLHGRGLSDATIDLAELGYSRGRIALPLFTQGGALVAIRYRYIKPYDGVRYTFEPLYGVRYTFERGSRPIVPYGLSIHPFMPLAVGVLFITEGEFKCLSVIQAGYRCYSTSGTLWSPGWTSYAEEFPRRIYLRDSRDLGGIASANRMKKMIPDLEVVRTPAPFKAIDDFFVAKPKEAKEFLQSLI